MKIDQLLVEQPTVDINQLAKEIVSQNIIDDVINLIRPKGYTENTQESEKV